MTVLGPGASNLISLEVRASCREVALRTLLLKLYLVVCRAVGLTLALSMGNDRRQVVVRECTTVLRRRASLPRERAAPSTVAVGGGGSGAWFYRRHDNIGGAFGWQWSNATTTPQTPSSGVERHRAGAPGQVSCG